MKLREISIKNFRCLVDVSIPIGDTTVLVGENNAGKTSFLNALYLALSRGIGSRLAFDEYDYHMASSGDSPEKSQGIIIELWFREDEPDEWPPTVIQALQEIVQTDPDRDIDSIGLRVSSAFDAAAEEIVSKSEFLALNGHPLGGKAASPANLAKFLNYTRLFYLSALRDSNAEFSPRSQYWGRILRDLKISEDQRTEIAKELTKLNDSLLKADPRLDRVRESLTKVQNIMALGTGHNTSIQALPLKPWDLMSKSEVVIKARGGEVDLPLARHGQGMQSLAVLFLFQAYIDVLLKPSFEPETEAILSLEEPEAHLHPQATRALAMSVGEIKGQKIISTHSPYFIQEIPFGQIRLFRRVEKLAKVHYVKRTFSAKLPKTAGLLEYCARNSAKFSYHITDSALDLTGRMEVREYRDLISLFPGQPDVHSALRNLRDESQLYLTDNQLADLDTYAKRIRGEVLFARGWFLCEGQCEYLLLRYFAELLGVPLDQNGVTVIDFQNNGSPGSFIALARVFAIPWLMVCDNDDALKNFIQEMKNRGLPDDEVNLRVNPIPEEKTDTELFLVRNGFAKEFLSILAKQGVTIAKKEGDAGFEEDVALAVRGDKTNMALSLIELLRANGTDKSRVPKFLEAAIHKVVSMVK